MKKYVFIFIFCLIGMCRNGFALAVIDNSNLAQNIISAREAIEQTQQQIQQLQTQLNQYRRMLQDAMNPGDWVWGDIQDTINQLRNAMSSLKSLSAQTGGVEQFLTSFGSYDDYTTGYGYGGGYSQSSSNLMAGDHAGSLMRKGASDAVILLVDEQESWLTDYQRQFERLKSNAASAEGQQEALQASNQFLSMQVELLTQIQSLLMAQNTMLAAAEQTAINREARDRMGSAIQFGDSDMVRKEREATFEEFTFD